MLNDIGILEDSIRYYHESDDFTADYLYHIPHAGIYHCDKQYEVTRNHLDVCQIIFVDDGELCVEYQGKIQTAKAGTIVLLDCRMPHRYYANSESLRMRWFHYTGNNSEPYTQLIIGTHGFILNAVQNPEIENCCQRIMMNVHQNQPNTHVISFTISKLLVLLVLLLGEPEKNEIQKAIESSAEYIDTHYADKDLKIRDLSQQAALSACYYIRKFKEYFSVTPHQYIQTVRLRMAKQQLTTTSHSIETIAENCGFCNTSHFVMTFRKLTGTTPLQFRVMWR